MKNGNDTWGIRGLGNLVTLSGTSFGRCDLVFLIGAICVICGFSSTVFANAVSVSNARLTNPGTPAGQVTVEFRVSQQNPFGNVSFDSVTISGSLSSSLRPAARTAPGGMPP